MKQKSFKTNKILLLTSTGALFLLIIIINSNTFVERHSAVASQALAEQVS